LNVFSTNFVDQVDYFHFFSLHFLIFIYKSRCKTALCEEKA